VLKRQQTLGKRAGGVVGVDGERGLAKDFAGVDFFDDKMHARAMFGLAGFERALMSFDAGILGQQRRVDIDEASSPGAHEEGRQHPHETGEGDDVDVVSAQRRVDLALKGLAVAAIGFVINGQRLDPGAARAPKALDVGDVGDDEDDLIVVLPRPEIRTQTRFTPISARQF
jgi:hypothetical protein